MPGSDLTPTPDTREAALTQADQLLAQTTRCRLDDQAFVVVSGADAHKFLQGQLTCHLDEVTATHSVCGSYCTVQGRMISSFRIAQRGDGALLLRMHHSVVDATIQTLKKYGVFSRVQIAADTDWVALALDGSASGSLLGHVPAGQGAAVATDRCITLQTDADGQRFEIWARRDAVESMWERLATATDAPAAAWHLRNIRAGIGHVESTSADLFIPQMLNFQLTGFVHFKKGCYTGQEIVARMQYLGKLKRHMYRYEVTGENTPRAGDELAIAGQAQSVGNIVNAVTVGEQRHDVLAVVTTDAMDNSSLHLRASPQSGFRRLELPYAITVGSHKS